MPIGPTDAQIVELNAEREALRIEGAASLAARPPAPPKPDPELEVAPGRDDGQLRPNAKQAMEMQKALRKAGVDPAVIAAAAQADQLEIDAPPSPELLEVDRQHGVSEDVDPLSYSPQFPRSLTDALPLDRLANVQTETTAWASVVALPPAMGNAVIEHISRIGPEYSRFTEDQKSAWQNQQHELALRHLGSEKAVEELKAKARAVALSAGPDCAFGKALADSEVFNNSWFLLRTLANFGDTKAAWAADRTRAEQAIKDRNVQIAQARLDRAHALTAEVADAKLALDRAKAAAAGR